MFMVNTWEWNILIAYSLKVLRKLHQNLWHFLNFLIEKLEEKIKEPIKEPSEEPLPMETEEEDPKEEPIKEIKEVKGHDPLTWEPH